MADRNHSRHERYFDLTTSLVYHRPVVVGCTSSKSTAVATRVSPTSQCEQQLVPKEDKDGN